MKTILLALLACLAVVSAKLSILSQNDDVILQQIIGRFYDGNSISKYVDVSGAELEKLIQRPEFDKTKRTVIYIHGYTENLQEDSVITVITAYKNAETDINLIAIDWSQLSDGNYLNEAIPNSEKVGTSLATKIKTMVDLGLNIELLHLVGHSLGGHVSGFLGKACQASYGFKVGRISALDPAGPGFNSAAAPNRLDVGDAKIVDVIHTDSKLFGLSVSIGSADFWPNPDVRFQPGCPSVLPTHPDAFCSHRRSWMYWAESISAKDAFIGYDENKNIYANMGESYDGRSDGVFRLQTNSNSPFGMGSDGIITY